MAERLQPAGFCWSVFLCLVLAVLKLTVKAPWSWGRVSLPIWAVLGHNILYITIGFAWLYFADDGAAVDRAEGLQDVVRVDARFDQRDAGQNSHALAGVAKNLDGGGAFHDVLLRP